MNPSTNRRAVVAAVMLANFLAAVDVSIIGTAMPTIIGTLGGLPIMSWVFSAFLLASTVTVPVYGKLADLFGRKIIFNLSCLVLLIGSVLCGLSQDMIQLIVFRAIQGLGAGGIMAVAATIIGDIFSVEERGRVQGLFSAVWGVSAVIGPLFGGLIIEFLSWEWVFYINVPIALVAMLVLWRALHENIEKKRHKIDYMGSITLTISMTALLLALLNGGNEYAWNSPEILSLFGTAAVVFGLFLWNEARVEEPLLPLDLFKNRTIAIAALTNLLIGGVLMGVSSYMPSYVQGVLGGTATQAGMVLTPLSLGWPLATFFIGSRLTRWGFRKTALLGMVLIAGSALALNVSYSDIWQPMVILFFMGMGMGLAVLAFLVAVQSAVEWNRRGVATASLQFIRSLGSAIGVAVMGAVMNATILAQLRDQPAVEQPLEAVNGLLDEQLVTTMDPNLVQLLRHVFDNGLHQAFLLLGLFGLLGLLVTFLFPRAEQTSSAK